MEIRNMIHPRERDYFIPMAVCASSYWFIIIIAVIAFIIFSFGLGLFVILAAWGVITLMDRYFKAVLYGEGVKVGDAQFPDIYRIARDQSAALGMTVIPDIFIVNGNGIINAFAVKFLSRRYVILSADLVDLSMTRGRIKELAMIIGHELAHHAAGHTDFRKNLFLKPAYAVPLLGTAYSRACELSADRIGSHLVNDRDASVRALTALSLGSESIADDLNIESFIAQEKEIPPFAGTLRLLFSTHPRMTIRVTEILNYMK